MSNKTKSADIKRKNLTYFGKLKNNYNFSDFIFIYNLVKDFLEENNLIKLYMENSSPPMNTIQKINIDGVPEILNKLELKTYSDEVMGNFGLVLTELIYTIFDEFGVIINIFRNPISNTKCGFINMKDNSSLIIDMIETPFYNPKSVVEDYCYYYCYLNRKSINFIPSHSKFHNSLISKFEFNINKPYYNFMVYIYKIYKNEENDSLFYMLPFELIEIIREYLLYYCMFQI